MSATFFLLVLSFNELPQQTGWTFLPAPSQFLCIPPHTHYRKYLLQNLSGPVQGLLGDSWCVWRPSKGKAHQEEGSQSTHLRHLVQPLRPGFHLLTNRLSRAFLKSKKGRGFLYQYCQRSLLHAPQIPTDNSC